MNRRAFLFAAVLASAAAVMPARTFADVYPSRLVRIIVPFPPGSASDILARSVAHKLSEALGQQFIVENRPGAGGVIGTDAAAKAEADGYTLLMATAAHAIAPAVYPKLSFDAQKDFAPITQLVATPLMLVAHPSVPANTVQELVALAKAKPGEINFASSGNGTSHHLAGELLKTATGVNITHVPYKGSAPAHLDLISGRVSIMFDNIVAVFPQVRAGKLKALAVTTEARSTAAPDLPTMMESGYPGFEVSAWFGLMAPAGTPKEIVDKLHAEAVKAVKDPDVGGKMTSEGAKIIASTPGEFNAYLSKELDKWAKVAKESGARAAD